MNGLRNMTKIYGSQELRPQLSQGPITWSGLARLAGLARFAEISARL